MKSVARGSSRRTISSRFLQTFKLGAIAWILVGEPGTLPSLIWLVNRLIAIYEDIMQIYTVSEILILKN